MLLSPISINDNPVVMRLDPIRTTSVTLIKRMSTGTITIQPNPSTMVRYSLYEVNMSEDQLSGWFLKYM